MTSTTTPTESQTTGADDQAERVARFKHPLATRWMHWVNFPLLLIMVWSGMRIYWANDVYSIGLFGWSFDFWPDSVNSTLELERKLAKGIAYHLTFGWFFVINGAIYILFLARSGEWRHIVPDQQAVRDVCRSVLHDVGLRKEAPAQGRYNPAQQLAYTAVLAMATLLVLSGFAIYKPTQLAPLTWILGGYEFARGIHFTMTILIGLFFVVHVLQVARAGWRNFAGMITGYELEPRPKAAQPAAPPAAAPADEDEVRP